ncbi:MAG: DNA polymerase III subunit gamma/tau [Nitrospiraceae bacterium]
MDYQVSARKYRPGTFDDVIGQPHVVQTLVNAVSTKRIAHAFLFSGTRGVGKTTVARILAKSLNCESGPTGTPCNSCSSCEEITLGNSVDVIEIDGASNTGVDDVREIRENVKFRPFRGHYRVYIIDEVHMLSNSAFNALLKTLEEPPAHVVFIFATTEIHKIPPTIVSRCQHYNFRRISKGEIVQRLRHVAEQDSLDIEDQSLMALARASEGSMRDALSLLDQVVAFGGSTIHHADLETLLGTVPYEHVRTMVDAILEQQSATALRVIADVLDQGHDLKTFCGDLVECVRNLLVAAVVPSHQDVNELIEASKEDVQKFVVDAKRLPPDQLQEVFRIFTVAEDVLRLSAHPRFTLEAAVVRATRLMLPKGSVAGETSSSDVQKVSATQAPKRGANSSVDAPTSRSSSAALQDRPRSSQDKVNIGQRDHASDLKRGLTAAARSTSVPPALNPSERALPRNESDEDVHIPTAPSPSLQTETHTPLVESVLEWEQFQGAVSAEYPNIAPFLDMGRFMGVEGHHVMIGFSKQATVARAMLEKADNLRALGALGERLIGQPVRIRIVELSAVENAGPTMKELRVAKEQEQRIVLFQQARAHPLVKQALELFGGELIDVRPLSLVQEVQE